MDVDRSWSGGGGYVIRDGCLVAGRRWLLEGSSWPTGWRMRTGDWLAGGGWRLVGMAGVSLASGVTGEGRGD